MRSTEVQNEEEKYRLLAWAISFEGSITIIRDYRPKSKTYCLKPKISISNTDLEILEQLLKIYKIGKIRKGRNGQNLNHKQDWIWEIIGQEKCKDVLIKIIEFIPIKRKKLVGELILEFCNIRAEYFKTARNTPYGKREYEILELIRKLNKRGLKNE